MIEELASMAPTAIGQPLIMADSNYVLGGTDTWNNCELGIPIHSLETLGVNFVTVGYPQVMPLPLGVKGPESDEEVRRVPEIGGESAGASATRPEAGSTAGPERVQGTGEGQKKRGRSPADKESKRLKRLLRNRVSAQQARERKKAYLIDLETRVADLEKKNSELKERLSTMQNENQMLRQILKNTTASRRGSNSGAGAD